MSIHKVVRVVFVAAVCLVVPAYAAAQEIGIKAGINVASVTPEEEDEAPLLSRRLGFAGGLWLRTPPAGRFSFQAEGLFSEKGVRFDGQVLGLDGDADIRFRYLEVPLLGRVDLGPGGATTQVFVVAGVAPALKLSARTTFTIDGKESTQDLGDQTESIDVGLVGGVGVAFGRAQVEARYTHGLLRTNTDHNDPEDRIQNRVFTVTAGFRFR